MLLPPAPHAVFYHRAVAVALVGKQSCAATIYGVSPVLNSTHLCRPPFTVPTNSPFSAPCGYSTHTGGPAPPPPSFPSPPFG